MFRNLSVRDAACLLLRVSLGVIFLVHGVEKVSHDLGTSWEPEFGKLTNVALAWGELVGGVAMLLGLLTRLTAIGFGFVMACALYVVGTTKGFQGTPDVVIKGFDYLRVGAEFPFALLLQCVAVLLLGGGAFSVDRCLRRSRAAKAGPGAVGVPHFDPAKAAAESSPN